MRGVADRLTGARGPVVKRNECHPGSGGVGAADDGLAR